MATAAEINEIIKLYVGYYNRAPDPAGLNFWIAAFDGGFGLDEMAVDFSTQAETLSNYPFFLNPSPTVEEYGLFVDAVYGNLFNRAPDGPGREFWSTKIASGEFSVGQAIILIIEGATTSPDQDVVANKVAVGRDFYIKTNALPEYTFDQDDIEAATNIQASVTEDPATVTAAAAQTDAYIAALGASTINLTNDTDQPGGGGSGADTQGSGGDDTYVGTIQSGDTGTLQAGDSIAAAGGNDTLNVRLVSTGSLSETFTLAATDLENIHVTDQVADNLFLNMVLGSVTGLEQITMQGSSSSNGEVAFSDVAQGVNLRMVDFDNELYVAFSGDQSSSSDDAFSLYVENSGTDDSDAQFFLSNSGTSGQNEDFEIANIETGGTDASFLDLHGLVINELNVTGSQEISISDSSDDFEALGSADASSMTGGGLHLNANDSTVASFSFMGSDFNDSVYLDNDLFNNANTMSLNGGDGDDILKVDFFTNLDATSVNAATSFEFLQSEQNTNTLEAADFTTIDTFIFAGESNNGSRTNVRGVTGDELFIFESDVGRGDETLRFEADTAGQTLNFELRAQEGNDGEIRIFSTSNSGSSPAAVGFSGSNITTVNLTSSGSNEEANVIRAIDQGSNNYFAFDNDGGPSNFALFGSQALTITAEEGVNLNASSDERGFSSGVNLDGSDATGALRIAGSASSDAIQGGSANDIIYSLGGDDVLTGNGGMDQFRYSDWSGTDQLQDFTAGEDKIGLNFDFDNTSASSDGTTLSSDDYVENLQLVANLTSADDNKLVELQSAATATQITDTVVDAFDTFLLVFNSTSGHGELWFDDDWNTTANRDQIVEFSNITDLAGLVGLTNTDFVEYSF